MSSTKNKIVLKKLKDTDNVWHSESTLVFKSSKDKVVIGRYFEKEIIPLDDLCLELCSKWKFKYDKDLVEEDEEEVVENEEGDEQESEQEDIKEKDDIKKNESEEEDRNDEEEEREEEREEEIEKIIELKKVENDESNNQLINYTKETYLTDITSDFSKKIYNYFDSVSQKYNQEILNLKNDIATKDKIHSELLKEHESTKEELKKLKTKFDGIKQLFSL